MPDLHTVSQNLLSSYNFDVDDATPAQAPRTSSKSGSEGSSRRAAAGSVSGSHVIVSAHEPARHAGVVIDTNVTSAEETDGFSRTVSRNRRQPDDGAAGSSSRVIDMGAAGSARRDRGDAGRTSGATGGGSHGSPSPGRGGRKQSGRHSPGRRKSKRGSEDDGALMASAEERMRDVNEMI